MIRHASALLLAVTLAACEPVPVEPEPGPAPDIAELQFEPMGTWARPIEDYIAFHIDELGHDQFDRSVQELHVFDGRLYLGYGDATLNLGRTTPIEVRRWSEPEPEAWQSEFVVEEEAIGRYRSADDVLVIPGVDATEDAWIGNAYTLVAGGEWVKSRTLFDALHVHDALVDGDVLWACGSGGNQAEYEAGQISSLVFRSDDLGVTWEQAWKVPNSNPTGDARFTSLALVDGALHAFGYRADGTGTINQVIAYRETDDEPEAWSAMSDVLVDDVQSLPDGRALATGVFVAGGLRHAVRLLDGDDADDVDAFDGLTVLDLFDLGDGRVVTLAIEGTDYPVPDDDHVVQIGLWDSADDSYATLISQDSGTLPVSLAFWRGGLYVGLLDGRVRRSLGI